MMLAYNQEVSVVARSFGASLKVGLDRQEVIRRREKFGPNLLPAEKAFSNLSLFIRQFQNPLVFLLLVAALITAVLQEWMDLVVILVAVSFDVILGFFQEVKAQNAIQALKKLTAPKARVMREKREQEIWASGIVPGDILILELGDTVSADARLILANDLRMDESILTGEVTPVRKQNKPLEGKPILPDQTNMVFVGTSVVGGNGQALVVATGLGTEMGKIAEHVRKAKPVATPLQKSLTRLGSFVSLGVVIVAFAIFLIGLMVGEDFVSMFLFAVALAVSAIPEGLVIEVTMALAISMNRMAKRKALVRHLPAVEGLGAVTVIAADKTGTLTRNELMVQELFFDHQRGSVTGKGYEPRGKLEGPERLKKSPTLQRLLTIGALCNNAQLNRTDGHGQVIGDPLEGALLVLTEKLGFDFAKARRAHIRELEIPFSSQSRFMAVLDRDLANRRWLFVKGAPRQILDNCRFEYLEGQKINLTESKRKIILTETRKMAASGLKPLGLAFGELNDGFKLHDHQLFSDLVFVGLVGVADPLRTEAMEAISRVYQAGVRVLMLTGDHRLTASSIAKKAGIKNPGEVLKGEELVGLTTRQLAHKLKWVNVYARVTPEHKFKIVQILQKQGEVVAMTGDGVNDAPALSTADIGVAMGAGGTEVARQAADLVLQDNNFATIVAAIEEGRAVFENLKKVILYLISTNSGEVLVILGALILGFPLPLYPTQILWLNLVTDGLPDNALIFEPRDQDVLKRPPRDPHRFILGKVAFGRIALFALVMALITLTLFWQVLPQGLTFARTFAFSLMAVFQLFNAFNLRSESESIFKVGVTRNWYLVFAVLISFLLQLAVVEVPSLQGVFRTMPLGWHDWGLIVFLGTTVIWAEEVRKLFFRWGKYSKLKTK